MRHFCRALALYLRSELSWRQARSATGPRGRYHLVARDGYFYVEPRIGA